MKTKICFVLLAIVAFTMPMLTVETTASAGRPATAFDAWPQRFDGRDLRRLPLSEREQRFGEDFPGRIARFSDGSREIIVRWVTRPTRKLHSAGDCFRALDYTITPGPVKIDDEERLWSSFVAHRDGRDRLVRERIYDNAGNSWIHVSGWYWAAILGQTRGPWWAVTVAGSD